MTMQVLVERDFEVHESGPVLRVVRGDDRRDGFGIAIRRWWARLRAWWARMRSWSPW